MHIGRALLIGAAAAALVLAGGQAASAASTTVARWAMEDTGTTMSDSSGHGHPGTLHGVTTQQPGFSGRSFGFLKKPSYVTVPSATDLNPGSVGFSFTVHIKFGALPSAAVEDFDVLRKGLATTSGGSYKLEILDSGKAFCDFRGATKEGYVASVSPLKTGVWHTVTCSRSTNAVQVVVDGVSRSRAVTTGTISNSGNLYIGAKNESGADQVTGYLDSISVNKG